MRTITKAMKQELIDAELHKRRALAHEITMLKDKLRTAEMRYKNTAEDLAMLENLAVVDEAPAADETPAADAPALTVKVGSGQAIHAGVDLGDRLYAKCGAGENSVMGSRRRAGYVSKVSGEVTCKRCGA